MNIFEFISLIPMKMDLFHGKAKCCHHFLVRVQKGEHPFHYRGVTCAWMLNIDRDTWQSLRYYSRTSSVAGHGMTIVLDPQSISIAAHVSHCHPQMEIIYMVAQWAACNQYVHLVFSMLGHLP